MTAVAIELEAAGKGVGSSRPSPSVAVSNRRSAGDGRQDGDKDAGPGERDGEVAPRPGVALREIVHQESPITALTRPTTLSPPPSGRRDRSPDANRLSGPRRPAAARSPPHCRRSACTARRCDRPKRRTIAWRWRASHLERKVRYSTSQGASEVHACVVSRTGPSGIVDPYRVGNGFHI
jgi:hypothetical protein